MGGLRAAGDGNRRDLLGEAGTGRNDWNRWAFRSSCGNFLETMRVILVMTPSNRG